MVKPDTPSHMPGTLRGEERAQTDHSGRDGNRRNQRDSTSINPEARKPILPGMPDLPPA
ncbi:MAG: hypothetical protein JWO56_338 [Acidobacteria bacterium]|nr:hypothetical protein [Acidobacteriota bacterium]